MGQAFRGISTVLLLSAFMAASACAGIPRGLTLMGDEQTGDETTGLTVARGHAEIAVENQPIKGTADVIELRPKTNEILFKGRADLTIGHEHFVSDTVTCTLDFSHCAAVDYDQPLPDVPGGVTAAISPR